MKDMFTDIVVSCAHELICKCGILRGIFVAGTYMAITCEVDIAAGNILVCISKSVGSLGTCIIISVWVLFTMWPPYLFNDIKYMYSDMGVDLTHVCTYAHVHAYIYTHTCIYAYIDIDSCMSDYIHT